MPTMTAEALAAETHREKALGEGGAAASAASSGHPDSHIPTPKTVSDGA